MYLTSNNTKRLVLLIVAFFLGGPLLVKGQHTAFSPHLVKIIDTVLLNTIKKYQHNIQKKEVMLIAIVKRQDTLTYYVTATISLYELSKNIPLLFTKVSNQYILLYSGIEQIIKINPENRKLFLSLFKGRLESDLLTDGKTRDPKSLGGGYDPIQVTVVTCSGKKIYEDYKKGFGSAGIPFLNKID